jgi:hypothetical protein
MSTEANVRALFQLLNDMFAEIDELFSDVYEPVPGMRFKGYGELYQQTVDSREIGPGHRRQPARTGRFWALTYTQ